MSAQPDRRLSIEEYLAGEEQSAIKHEYDRGAIVAMTGASAQHNLIVANLLAALHGLLRTTRCRVFPSDMRLKIPAAGLYTYPDLSVVCGDLDLSDDRLDTLLNPILLIEVLSPSTENYDRGKKFEAYRTIPTLQEYLVVAQDRVHVEQYLRQRDDRWLLIDYYALDQTIRSEALQVTLTIADIYAYVAVDPDDR